MDFKRKFKVNDFLHKCQPTLRGFQTLEGVYPTGKQKSEDFEPKIRRVKNFSYALHKIHIYHKAPTICQMLKVHPANHLGIKGFIICKNKMHNEHLFAFMNYYMQI